jgi:hypothetical protein
MSQTNIHEALLDINKRWLRQALDLLGRIDDRRFSTSPRGLAPHRVCSHLRHIVEFYECFLDGLESTHIDYDARKRDLAIESSPCSAATRVCSIIDRLETEPALQYDNALFVRVEDGDALDLLDPYLMSSVGRELMTLSNHTIHHFALIAMTLRVHGMAVDPDFGMAPSTLRNNARNQALLAAKAA